MLADLSHGVLTVTLNRPDKLNAYNPPMQRDLMELFARINADDEVRAVVVTGAGRAFCAGADISGGAEAFSDAERLFGEAGQGKRQGGGFVQAIFQCRKPSIAAINGAAVGVGLTLTLPMDIRIASSNARFGLVFTRRGLVPEAGSAWFLPRIVGLPRALRWCYSGQLLDAAEAERGGLIEPAFPADELLPRARVIAREIVEHTAPVAVALTRQLLWRFAPAPNPWDLLQVDTALNLQLGAGPDVREGVAAFIDKRPPQFPGKVSADMPSRYPWWDAA
jgi:enoyl-CoA hydratase/carnithine racemase